MQQNCINICWQKILLFATGVISRFVKIRLRITIGTPEENKVLLQALKTYNA